MLWRTLMRAAGFILLLTCISMAPAQSPPTSPRQTLPLTDKERADLDRDEAAAEAAGARGDLAGALRYMDYFGHEQEDFAAAMLEYDRSQGDLRRAVIDKLGQRAWRRTAAALGIPRHRRRGRDGDDAEGDRTLRREGRIVYIRNAGARHDIPYVNVDGVWKVSVRDVLLTALKARFGPGVKFEEADLHVLAGKMAKVVRRRGKRLADLAASVRAGRVATPDALREAAAALRAEK